MLDEVDERLSGNSPLVTQHVTDELIRRATEMLVAIYHVQSLCDEATFAEDRDREELIALTEASRNKLYKFVKDTIVGHVYAVAGDQRGEYEARLKLLRLVDDEQAPAAAAPTPIPWTPLFRIVADAEIPVPVVPTEPDGSPRVADGVIFLTAEQAIAVLPGRSARELTSLWQGTMREYGYEPGMPPADPTAKPVKGGTASGPVAPEIDPFDYPATTSVSEALAAAEAIKAEDSIDRLFKTAPTLTTDAFPVGRRIFTAEQDGGFVVAFDGERVFSWGVFNDGDQPTLLYDELQHGVVANNNAVDDEADPGGFEPFYRVAAVLDQLTSDPFVGMSVRHHTGEIGTVALGHGLAIVAIVDARRLELWERGDCVVQIDQPKRDVAVIRAILSLMPVESVPPPAAKGDVVDTPATSEVAA